MPGYGKDSSGTERAGEYWRKDATHGVESIVEIWRKADDGTLELVFQGRDRLNGEATDEPAISATQVDLPVGESGTAVDEPALSAVQIDLPPAESGTAVDEPALSAVQIDLPPAESGTAVDEPALSATQVDLPVGDSGTATDEPALSATQVDLPTPKSGEATDEPALSATQVDLPVGDSGTATDEPALSATQVDLPTPKSGEATDEPALSATQVDLPVGDSGTATDEPALSATQVDLPTPKSGEATDEPALSATQVDLPVGDSGTATDEPALSATQVDLPTPKSGEATDEPALSATQVDLPTPKSGEATDEPALSATQVDLPLEEAGEATDEPHVSATQINLLPTPQNLRARQVTSFLVLETDATVSAYFITFEWDNDAGFPVPTVMEYDRTSDTQHAILWTNVPTSGNVYVRARFTTAAADAGTRGPWSDTFTYRGPVNTLMVTAVDKAAAQGTRLCQEGGIEGPDIVVTGGSGTGYFIVEGGCYTIPSGVGPAYTHEVLLTVQDSVGNQASTTWIASIAVTTTTTTTKAPVKLNDPTNFTATVRGPTTTTTTTTTTTSTTTTTTTTTRGPCAGLRVRFGGIENQTLRPNESFDIPLLSTISGNAEDPVWSVKRIGGSASMTASIVRSVNPVGFALRITTPSATGVSSRFQFEAKVRCTFDRTKTASYSGSFQATVPARATRFSGKRGAARDEGMSIVDLSWDAVTQRSDGSTAMAVTYVLERREAKGAFQALRSGLTSTSYADTVTDPATGTVSYTYRLKAQETGYIDSNWVEASVTLSSLTTTTTTEEPTTTTTTTTRRPTTTTTTRRPGTTTTTTRGPCAGLSVIVTGIDNVTLGVRESHTTARFSAFTSPNATAPTYTIRRIGGSPSISARIVTTLSPPGHAVQVTAGSLAGVDARFQWEAAVRCTSDSSKTDTYRGSFAVLVRAVAPSINVPDQTVGVDETITLDLDDHTSNNSGATYSLSDLSLLESALVAVSISGSTLTIRGRIEGSVTFTVTARTANGSGVDSVGVTVTRETMTSTSTSTTTTTTTLPPARVSVRLRAEDGVLAGTVDLTAIATGVWDTIRYTPSSGVIAAVRPNTGVHTISASVTGTGGNARADTSDSDSDSYDSSSTMTTTTTTRDPNRRPTVSVTPSSVSVREDRSVTVQATATDPDSDDRPTISARVIGGSSRITASAGSTSAGPLQGTRVATITISGRDAGAGTATVRVTATDEGGLTHSQDIRVTVVRGDGITTTTTTTERSTTTTTTRDSCAGLSVRVRSIGNDTVGAGSGNLDLELDATISDNASDPLYSVARLRGSRDINASIGGSRISQSVLVTIPGSVSGTISTTFRVTAQVTCTSDSSVTETDTEEFTVTVRAAADPCDGNRAPTISADVSSMTLDVGESDTFEVTVADQDSGDLAQLTVDSSGSSSRISVSVGSLSSEFRGRRTATVTVTGNRAGSATATATVTDPCDDSDSDSVSVTVGATTTTTTSDPCADAAVDAPDFGIVRGAPSQTEQATSTGFPGSVRFTKRSGPSWVSVSSSGAVTARPSGSVTPGDYTYRIRGTGGGCTDEDTGNILVTSDDGTEARSPSTTTTTTEKPSS